VCIEFVHRSQQNAATQLLDLCFMLLVRCSDAGEHQFRHSNQHLLLKQISLKNVDHFIHGELHSNYPQLLETFHLSRKEWQLIIYFWRFLILNVFINLISQQVSSQVLLRPKLNHLISEPIHHELSINQDELLHKLRMSS